MWSSDRLTAATDARTFCADSGAHSEGAGSRFGEKALGAVRSQMAER